MLELVPSTRFKRDLKRLKKQGKDKRKLQHVVEILQTQTPLPTHYRDHSLVGNWTRHRECHIEPDWLLIYQIDTKRKQLILRRTGSHSDLLH